MPWAKLDDGWFDDPKLMEAGPEAKALHAASISYSAKHLTDGLLSEQMAGLLASVCIVGTTTATDLIDRMVEHRLWDEEIDGDSLRYRVHDYLDYNPPRAEVLAARQARRAGGKLGAKKRWHPDVMDGE